MNEEILAENTAFTEWYHYALLLFWLILLFVGLKYFQHIESYFKPKEGFVKGKKYAVNLLSSSFVIGILLFAIMIFKPAEMEGGLNLIWNISEYLMYATFLLLLILNAFICINNYQKNSSITRVIVISLLMILYFYSGMLGGLMVIAFLALFIIIYTFIKFKKILTIK